MNKCSTCKTTLERGSVNTYKDGEVINRVCFDCAKAEDFDTYDKTKILRTHLMMDAILIAHSHHRKYEPNPTDHLYLKQSLEIDKHVKLLQKRCKEFEKEVWFGGLQDRLDRSDKKGVSANCSTIQVLTYCMCGRCMLTLTAPTKESITFLADEKSKRSSMGVHGIDATYEEADAIISAAIKAWKSGELDFKEDQEVHIAGM